MSTASQHNNVAQVRVMKADAGGAKKGVFPLHGAVLLFSSLLLQSVWLLL